MPSSSRQLALGAISFTVCFAAWGLIGAFAPRFRETSHLSATEAALMVAVPVLLGSLARLPMGMLTDRFGGRLAFSLLMLTSPIPCGRRPMRWFRRPDREPLWRDEFSVFQADERYVSRRQLTGFLTLTSLGMLAGNLWILARSWFHREPAWPSAKIARLGEIPVGGVKLFPYPDEREQCILVRTGEDQYAAYSQKCTHLSCAVYYVREQDRLECPCHKGYFSVRDGSVLQGPPRRPLPRVVLERRGDDLVAVALRTGGENA